jgi:hypothetical protein
MFFSSDKTRARALPLMATLALASAGVGVVGACNGTGAGDTGDKIVKDKPSVAGQGQRISDVVGEATWYSDTDLMSQSCKLPATEDVNLTGQVVVAVDTYDESGKNQTGNIYIEDVPVAGADPVPYSGLTLFGVGFSPPDLRLFEGDVVDTFGTLDEFVGPSVGAFNNCRTLPEASGTVSFRYENGFHAPVTLVQAGSDPTRWNNLKGYKNARQWIGMLVKVNDVTLPNAGKCYSKCPRMDCQQCQYSLDIDVGGGVALADTLNVDNELFDLKTAYPQLGAGSKVKSITGVLTYFYGFHIAPRSADDIEL